MKRFFTLFMLLAALLCSTTLRAESYGLRVAGVEVTDANKDNITGSGISGKITYNPSTKRLTFAAGTNIVTNSDGISNYGVDGLSILFEGDVTIKTSCTEPTAAGIICFKNTTFTKYTSDAAPTIKFTNTGTGGAIHTYQGAKIDTWGVWIYAQADNNDAIKDLSPGTGSMVFNYSRLYVKGGSGKCAFKDFTSSSGIVFKSSVLESSSYKFDASKGGVVNSSGNLVQECWIVPSIMIGRKYIGTNEYELTKEGVGAGTSASGKVKWNQSAGTLTLTNVNVNGSYFVVRVPNLKIVLDGDCSFESTTTAYDPGISTYENITIEGDATLKLTAHNVAGLEARNNANITLNLKELQALGKTNGVSTGGTLTLNKYNDNTVYKFAGETANVYARNLVMNGVDISTENTYWNPSDGYTYYNGSVDKSSSISNGTWFKSTNQISYYPIWVAGAQIRQNSAAYINSPGITSGRVFYDSSTKTLTFDSAVIKTPSGDDNEGVRSEIDGLTVKLVGSNEINTEGDCFYTKAPMTFAGDGKLVATSTKGSGLSVEGNNKVTVKVDNEVYFTGAKYGYWGHHDNDSRPDCDLILTAAGSSSDYYFRGTDASVYQASHIVCDGMDYFYNSSYGTPGCYFDEASHYVKQNGGVIVKGTDVNYYKVDTHYGIMVGGTEITNCNRRAVGSPYINKPLGVSYDDNSNTLTLDDVTINYTGTTVNNYDIKLSHGKCKINVIGDNVLTGNDKLFSPLWLEWNSEVELAGDGTLKLGSGYSNGYGLYLYQSAATIGGSVALDVTGATHGIGSNSTDQENFGKLTVKGNAHVKAKTIENVSSFTLEDGQTITEPAGAQYKDNAVRVGDNIALDVVIEKLTGIAIDATNFPDDNFRAWLLNSENINGYGADALLAPTEIADIKEINVKEQNIANLKGIEFLTALENLIAKGNALTSIDVSNNTALVWLDLGHNQLTSIDVSNNTALIRLYLNANQLTSIDVSNNTALILLDVYDNKLTSLDVSKNTALNDLDCGSNQLTTLDVSNNTKLITLYCDVNKLTSINVTMLPYLKTFYCAYNDLNTIDVSKNTALINLFCQYCKLSTLDVSKNTALEGLVCGGNQLTSLDISKNQQLTSLYIYSNLIAEAEMGKIVAQLPTVTEGFLKAVNLSDAEEKNVITTKQVADAKAKGWNVYAMVDGSETPYDGYDAINGIDEAKTNVTDIYDAAGRKLDQTRRGINIVRTADGKTQKVLKR